MHTPDDQPVLVDANDPAWLILPDLAALLTALFDARNVPSDKHLATEAKKFPPYNEIGEKSIQQWRTRVARPGPGSSMLLEQIGQALGVPDDDTALGKAWRLRVSESNAKRRRRAPKLPRTLKREIVTTVVSHPGEINDAVKEPSSPSGEHDALSKMKEEKLV